MLIRFIVQNYKSFKEETDFNLLIGSVRKHPNHVMTTQNGIDVLPTALIYGSNASGKSNLIKAIHQAKKIITQGTIHKNEGFELDKFAFDKNCLLQPVKFEFEFETKNTTYAYGLVIDYDQVIEEWLYEITAKKEDKLLFERKGRSMKFSANLTNNPKDKSFLENEARGLRINQPFLTEAYLREVQFFDDAYLWFAETLQIIFPTNKFNTLEYHVYYNLHLKNLTNSLLSLADVGTKIDVLEIDVKELILRHPEIKEVVQQLRGNLQFTEATIETKKGEYYSLYKENLKEIKAVKIITKHPSWEGKDIEFEIHQESDGTRRLIELAPALSFCLFSDKVYLIDEIDRSMHPLLTKKLLEVFIEKRQALQSKGQFICSTHEDYMIDMKLFRSDEIWFVQKSKQGVSKIYPLSDFVVRYDVDIKKGYLNGRFGGIPFLGNANFLDSY